MKGYSEKNYKATLNLKFLETKKMILYDDIVADALNKSYAEYSKGEGDVNTMLAKAQEAANRDIAAAKK